MGYTEKMVLGMTSIVLVSYCIKKLITRNVSIKVIETIHKSTLFMIFAYIPFASELYCDFPLSIMPILLMTWIFGCAGLVSSSTGLNRCKRVTVTLKLNDELIKFKDYLQCNYAKERLKHTPHFNSDTYILEDPFSSNTIVFNLFYDRLEIHAAQQFVSSFANYFSSNKSTIPIL